MSDIDRYELSPAYTAYPPVQAIDLDSLSLSDRIELDNYALLMKMTPDGSTLYVSVPNANVVTAIDIATRVRIADIPIASPLNIAIDAEGSTAYVRSIGPTGEDLVAIDTRSNQVVATRQMPNTAFGIALLPQTSQVFLKAEDGFLIVEPRDYSTYLVTGPRGYDKLLALGIRLPTRTPTPRPTSTPRPTATLSPTGSRTPLVPCPGDCDGDQQVNVDELMLVVLAALGSAPPSVCSGVDLDANGRFTVDEIVMSVDRALNGCEAQLSAQRN